MKVFQTIAKEQNEIDEIGFLQALDLMLQNCPEHLVTIDETHKDRNAARRRRGWGPKGYTNNFAVKEWHDNVARYTLIASADIHGFLPCACHTVLHNIISDEGTAGTVDSEYFLYWVKNYLCRILGNYERGEPRSVVMLDNAEVENAIGATGAILLYCASYSPHLNPIEKHFSIYRVYLKKIW